jgi:hypothetical protein
MNTRWGQVGAAALAFGLGVGNARADAPPMPPCPPGYTQVGAMECRAPFQCPNGWILAQGPKCVPWTCKQGQGCGHPRNQCVASKLCLDDKGNASRYCDDARPCAAGEQCKEQNVCSNGGGQGPFANWTPAGAGTGSAVTPQANAPARPPASAAALPEPAPKHGGCGSCASTKANAPSWGDGALVLLGLLLVTRPRARRALP